MPPKAPFRQLISSYIGGGWGSECCSEEYPIAARVIRGTDIPSSKIGITMKVPERFHKTSNYRSRVLKSGDIIMEVSGGSKDQPVGRSILVTARLLGKLENKAIPASFCKRLEPNVEVADPAFISYILEWLYQSRSITQWQVQSTGISNFNFEAFLDECEVPVPELSTQRRIASTLSAYDNLIENNTRRIILLEEIARNLYEEWFVRFRFPGHKQLKMVESELGLIPEGWEPVTVTQLVEVNPKIRISRDGTKPFVPMSCLSETSMLITEVEFREGNSGSKFQNGDTLFARITPCLENGKTGYVQFLSNSSDVAFGSTEFIVLRSKTVCPEYVYLLARSDRFRENAIKSMSGATGRQRVKEACFDLFYVAQPDLEVIQEFQKSVEPMFTTIKVLEQKNANLRITRDLLIPKLISGELDVSNLPEPEEANAA